MCDPPFSLPMRGGVPWRVLPGSAPARGWLIAFLPCTCAGISLLRGGLLGGRACLLPGQGAAVLAPPSGLRAPSPGVRPGSVFMRVKFARREVPGRICGGGCACDLEPGPMPPPPTRRGWPTPDRVVQRGVVGCSPERLCVSRLGGWGVVDGLRTAPQTQGFPAHPLCPSVSSKQGKIFL